MMMVKYFDIVQAAKYLCCEVSSLYTYTAHRVIPFLKAGGHNLFRVSELDLWLNTGSDHAAAIKIVADRIHRLDDENINMNVEETARYLHLEQSTMYRLKYDGRIPYVKMRTKLLFRTVEIDRWLDYGGTYEMAVMIMATRQVVCNISSHFLNTK